MPEQTLVERLRQGVIVMGFGPGQGEMVDVVTANQAMRKAAARIERLEAALREIAHLRPAGDVNTAKNTRGLVEQMECLALAALSASHEGEE